MTWKSAGEAARGALGDADEARAQVKGRRTGAWTVRTRNGVSVRVHDRDGIEIELDVFPSDAAAVSFARRINAILIRDDTAALAMLAVSILAKVYGVAHLIASAEDTPGTAAYATKSHMRAWAQAIANDARYVCEISGAFSAAAPAPEDFDDNGEVLR